MDKYLNFAMAIKRVKTLSFQVNEQLFKDGNEKIAIDFGHRNELQPNTNLFSFVMRINYRYADAPKGQYLAFIEVINTFEIVDFKSYIDKEQRVLFPEEVWLSILSMSIGHVRALLADRLAGTVLQNLTLPITDANILLDKFFPKVPAEEISSDLKEKAST